MTLADYQKITNQIIPFITAPIELGIILGTGLHHLVEHITIEQSIDYNSLEGYPLPTVESHIGKIIIGTFEGKRVICFQGRLHYYEGYTMQQVVLPIRIMQLLHINKVWITNASGGLNPAYNKGDIMMISDHINLQNENPLRGENIDKLGVRFTDMLHTYQPEWIKKAVEIATKKRIVLHDGVYVAVAGPNLETPAEYKMLRLLGADVVGMSTVPEVLAAKHGGMQIAAFSIITDVCFPIERLQAVTINDIIKVANDAQPFLIEILKELIHEV